MIILGIDPGTRVTGYGIIVAKQHSLEALDFGCIRPSANLSLHDKYLMLHKGVTELLLAYKPEVLAIETQFFKLNFQTAMKLGMARGAIILAARLNGIEVAEYSPSNAKKAITGTGRASKEQVQGMTQKLLCLAQLPTPEDAADALSIAICHAHRINHKGKLCTLTSKVRSPASIQSLSL